MANNIYENFCYLDTLKDTTIDFTAYLEYFSDDTYTLEFSNSQPAIATLVNLFEKYTVIEDFKDKNASFTIHNIQEGELPEDVAIDYYGSEDFWWVILLFNDIQNPLTEWPLTVEQIQYLVDVYVEKENRYTYDAYYNLIFDWNENKRRVEVLTNDQLAAFILQFQQELVTQSTDSRFKILL